MPATEIASNARRRSILEAATGVFMRYGYRKTSMEQVAQTAQISRQGLYMYFVAKEALFRATVLHLLNTSLEDISTIIADDSLSLQAKIVSVFNEWQGKHIDGTGANRWELLEAAHLYVGDNLIESAEKALTQLLEALFHEAISSGGITIEESSICSLVDVLRLISQGATYRCKSNEEFIVCLRTAVNLLVPSTSA